MFTYELAYRLHKTVAEIDELSVEEIDYWSVFFKIKEKQQGISMGKDSPQK